jgi:tRNA dimethylallyltransferase
MTEPRIILIAGPTASGKSALALALAEHFDGIVVNADSMQVYRELRILTARPSPDEEARVPHHHYGVVAGSIAFSVGQWLDLAVAVIAQAAGAGKAAIVVGGTGLYFKALTQGLAPVPEIPGEVRAYWRQQAERLSPEALHAALAERDPETAAQLRPSDPQRLVRALEVLEATGRPLADWQRVATRPPLPALAGAARLVMVPDRAWLWQRIAGRCQAMISEDAIGEVDRLRRLALAPTLPIMKAIGVAEIGALIDGNATMEVTKAAMIQATRRYAKRQATWITGQMPDWFRLDPAGGDASSLLRQVLSNVGPLRD